MNRRDALKLAGASLAAPAASSAAAAGGSPIVNAAEHAWVIHDPRFAPDPRLSNCPNSIPDHDYSREHLLAEMRTHGIDKTVISHVCYYGTNNSYVSYCCRTYPDKFAGIGLLVGHRLYSPADKENPSRLERLMKQEHLVGLRLSPRYDPNVVWLNDPVSYPLWKRPRSSARSSIFFCRRIRLGRSATWPSASPA